MYRLISTIVLFLSIILNYGCSGLIDGPKENDTNFLWESKQVSTTWGKKPLKLETMFGFKLRMSKLEYDSNFNSLILNGLANHKKQIKFGDSYDEYFEVQPHFYGDTLFQIDFQIMPTLTSFDTNERLVDMLDVIEKLYTANNIKKTDTLYKSDSKEILFYIDALGWIENNRLIKVYRNVTPESIITNYNFDNVNFIDLELKLRVESGKLIDQNLILDTLRKNKLRSISN